MRDPLEGLDEHGFIVTGAHAARIPAVFEPVLGAACEAIAGAYPTYLYGSVATGQAVVGRSDVDLVAVGMPTADARGVANPCARRG